jgi:hypothetical protein
MVTSLGLILVEIYTHRLPFAYTLIKRYAHRLPLAHTLIERYAHRFPTPSLSSGYMPSTEFSPSRFYIHTGRKPHPKFYNCLDSNI